MKKNLIKKTALALLLTLCLGIAIPATQTYAWGPERTTYTNESPSDHVQFNSITNNVAITDERDFVRVAEDDGDGTYTWVNSLEIEAGKKYLVMIYYHNNAASNLNSGEAVGLARNARVRSKFPTTVSSTSAGEVYAEISADNACNMTSSGECSDEKRVWDEAYFTTSSEAEIVLHYVEGSATIYNQGEANGTILSSEYLFTETGQPLGYNQLLGNLPGCSEYSGQIVYSVYTTQVGATVNKTVSADGENFSESVEASPGDTLTYRIDFVNSGTADLVDVVFRDKLPDGVTLIEGTTVLTNESHPDGITMNDIIDENGFSTGTYGPGATATITYQVKVNDDIFSSDNCDNATLENLIIVDHNEGEISDGATIVVKNSNNDCDELPTEIVSTGPLEITLAVVVILAVAGGAYYLFRTNQTLKKVETTITGTDKPEDIQSDSSVENSIDTKDSNPFDPDSDKKSE